MMGCDACKVKRSATDCRLSVGLRDALGLKQHEDDDNLTNIWRALFVAGVVDKPTPVHSYEV